MSDAPDRRSDDSGEADDVVVGRSAKEVASRSGATTRAPQARRVSKETTEKTDRDRQDRPGGGGGGGGI